MGSISHLRSLVRSLAGCHLTIGMRPVLVAIMIFFGLTPLALAGSGEPAATISAPQTVQLGSTFSFSVSFDNTSSDTTGFGPFVDVALRRDRTGWYFQLALRRAYGVVHRELPRFGPAGIVRAESHL